MTMPSKEALEWAELNRFSALTGAETIIAAYAAQVRLMEKISKRKAEKLAKASE